MVTQGGELSVVEQWLVDHVSDGERLELVVNEVGSEAEMLSSGESRTCRATVIRDILLGRLGGHPDPRGLRLRGARITGRLDLGNVTTGVNVELTDCLLEEGIIGQDARLASVLLTGCRIEHPSEPPLDGTRLTCSVLVLHRASVIGHSNGGAVRLSGASIGGQLDCSEATLRNDSGPALVADSLVVDQNVSLVAVDAYGSDAGAVRLSGAHIGGSLVCNEARLRSDYGTALNGDGLKVTEGVFLRRLDAVGRGGAGAVRLSSAQIGRQLDCRGATLVDDSGPALFADSLQVGQGMLLADEFAAIGGGEGVTVDLTGALVGGAFVFGPARLQHGSDPHRRIEVDGLTYAGVPERISFRDWVQLLRHGTPHYAAQPYQQLAAGYRTLGDERQVRMTLMTQRDDQLFRTHQSWPERWWGRITKVAVGYGYQPWRLLLLVSAVVALSCLLAVALGPGALTQTDKTATPGQPCSIIQELSVGLDLNLPFGTSLAREDCALAKNPSTAATWLTGAGLVLRVLAWAFAAWFAATIAGALRKT